MFREVNLLLILTTGYKLFFAGIRDRFAAPISGFRRGQDRAFSLRRIAVKYPT
jgi:hypothetical protein